MSDELLGRIQQQLDRSGVWIDPAYEDLLTPKQVRQIETGLANADDPIFLVVQELDDADDFGGDAAELLTQLHDRSGTDGLYLAPSFFDAGDGLHGSMTDRLWGPGPDTWQADAVARERHVDSDGVISDPGAWLTDYVTLLADGTAAEAYEREAASDVEEQAQSGSATEERTSTPSAPEDGDFPVIGVVSVSAVVLLLLAGVVLFLRERRRTAPFELPRSVISQVRDAHDAQLAAQARREVLALGEAIDATEIPAGDTGSAWPQTLDSYSTATRVLDRAGEDDLLDIVGALVLARTGQDALAAAQAGRVFAPAAPCFLNPLHTGTRVSHRLQTGGRRIKVPLCSQCRHDLAAGRQPDALDVIQTGQPVHYFESGIEPWASTGYGAVAELLPALRTERDR